MKISFIIPCYNVENYIERCITSILAMNEDEIEIIAVNDGSTDNTINILNKFKNSNNITVISFEKPSGFAGRPRNAGIKVASGDFLAFIDADDYYIGNEIINSYEKYKKYDVIVNSFVMKDDNGKVVDKVKLKDKDVNRSKFLWNQIKNVCNQRSIFKRSFIEKNNIRFVEDCLAEDLIFLYSCYVDGARLRTTSLLTTVYFDDRAGSVSTDINDKFIESSIVAYNRFLKVIENSLPTKEVNSAIGEHYLGYYLKVKDKLNSKQKEDIIASNFYKYIKDNIVHMK